MHHLHTLAEQHYAWVDAMGWHNKTPLASLGLIGEEIGEAIKECRSGAPSERFIEEVADVVLRIMDLDITLRLGIFREDLTVSIYHESLALIAMQEDPEKTHIDHLTPLYALLGDAIRAQVNYHGPLQAGQKGTHAPLKRIAAFCFAVTKDQDLVEAIEKKMAKNLSRGHWGRKH